MCVRGGASHSAAAAAPQAPANSASRPPAGHQRLAGCIPVRVWLLQRQRRWSAAINVSSRAGMQLARR